MTQDAFRTPTPGSKSAEVYGLIMGGWDWRRAARYCGVAVQTGERIVEKYVNYNKLVLARRRIAELEPLLDDACGTLADIAFSTDLTLDGCRKKAQKHYAAVREITDPEDSAAIQARLDAAEPEAGT